MKHLATSLIVLLFLSTDLSAQSLRMVLPHFAANKNQFTTQVTVENRAKKQKTFLMRHLDGRGNFISFQEFTLGAGQNLTLGIPTFEGVEPTHAIFDNADDLFAGVTFTPTSTPQNPIFVEGITYFAKRWRVYPSNWNLSFDGLAIVNPACFPSVVSIRHYNAKGEILDEVKRGAPLESNAKWLVSLEDLFTYETGSYIEVVGDEGLAVMALKGNRQFQRADSFLVGNLAVPQPNFADMRSDLRANRDKWSLAGFSGTYTIQAQKICFCTPDYTRPVEITVKDFQFDSVNYVDSGMPVEVGRIPDFYTVEGLFDFIESIFSRDVANVFITYDETYGYPKEVSIDFESCLVDEEITYKTTLMQTSSNP